MLLLWCFLAKKIIAWKSFIYYTNLFLVGDLCVPSKAIFLSGSINKFLFSTKQWSCKCSLCWGLGSLKDIQFVVTEGVL